MKLISPTIQGEYDPSLVHYFGNPKQSFIFAQYIRLYDVLLGTEGFLFAFGKEDIKPLQEKWRKFELENKNASMLIK